METLARNDTAPKVLAHPEAEKQNTSEFHLTCLIDAVKAALLKGAVVRLIDFKPEERAQVIGIIATLRDEFPVSCRWVTIRESHLSETRLRAKSYHIKGEHLRDVVPA